MLGKLLKHEFKVTSRYFIPMFILIAAITLLLKISLVFSEGSIFMSMEMSTFFNIIQGIFISIYVIVLIGTTILSLFLLIKRFYSNMFGDEGYLTHTLPVSGTQLLNSKLICSFIWILTLIPIWLISFLILFSGTDTLAALSYYGSILIEGAYSLDFNSFSVGLIIAELVLMLILGLICSLLTYYLCITLGQHFWSEHRLIGAILAYLILSVISSAVRSVFTAILEMTILNNSMFVTIPTVFQVLTMIFGAAIIITLIQIIVYYIVTNYLITKKLNLY